LDECQRREFVPPGDSPSQKPFMMRILVVSDLHGDLKAAHRACDIVRPNLILVINVGATPEGWYVIALFDASRGTLEASLERLPES
jgi:hypothetical protein